MLSDRSGAEVLAAFLAATGGDTVFDHPGVLPRPRVLLTAAVHGDESGPLWALAAMIAELRDGRLRCDVPLRVVVGNPVAVLRERRFVDVDLNRALSLGPGDGSVEGRRAEAIKPTLRGADLHVDLHQTRGPTDAAAGPFAIGTWGSRKRDLVQAMGLSTWCVSPPGTLFAPGLGVALVDEYAEAHGAVSVTVEVFQRGVRPEVVDATRGLVTRLIAGAEGLAAGRPLRPAEPAPLRHLALAHVEPYADPGLAMRALPNLGRVRAGDVVTEASSSTELRAPEDGFVMFAKFGIDGPPLPLDAYRLYREIGDPTNRWTALEGPATVRTSS